MFETYHLPDLGMNDLHAALNGKINDITSLIRNEDELKELLDLVKNVNPDQRSYLTSLFADRMCLVSNEDSLFLDCKNFFCGRPKRFTRNRILPSDAE